MKEIIITGGRGSGKANAYEKLKKAMSAAIANSLCIDFEKTFTHELRTATEIKSRIEPDRDRLDSMKYVFQMGIPVMKYPMPLSILEPTCDDKFDRTKRLEKLLKRTKGKARRKIRRKLKQLRKKVNQ